MGYAKRIEFIYRILCDNVMHCCIGGVRHQSRKQRDTIRPVDHFCRCIFSAIKSQQTQWMPIKCFFFSLLWRPSDAFRRYLPSDNASLRQQLTDFLAVLDEFEFGSFEQFFSFQQDNMAAFDFINITEMYMRVRRHTYTYTIGHPTNRNYNAIVSVPGDVHLRGYVR